MEFTRDNPIIPPRIRIKTKYILTPAIYDEFTEGKLDSEKWLVAMRNWGGYADAERTKTDYIILT